MQCDRRIQQRYKHLKKNLKSWKLNKKKFWAKSLRMAQGEQRIPELKEKVEKLNQTRAKIK